MKNEPNYSGERSGQLSDLDRHLLEHMHGKSPSDMSPRMIQPGSFASQSSVALSQDAQGASISAQNGFSQAALSPEYGLAAPTGQLSSAPSLPRLTLPTDSAERKNYPLFSGVKKYFPAALAGVAKHSKLGNDKHNPGQPLHHSRSKSNDHADCIERHLTDLADFEVLLDNTMAIVSMKDLCQLILTEANALAWRALALSQELHEKYGGAPLAPGAKL